MAVHKQLLESPMLDSIGPALTAAAEDLQSEHPQPDHAAARYWPAGTQGASELVVSQQQLLLHSRNLLTLWACFLRVGESSSSSADSCHTPQHVQQELADDSAAAAALAASAASAAAAVQLAGAVMELVSRDIPQLVAADRQAVLQAVHVGPTEAVLPGSSTVDTTVAGRATLLFKCVHLAFGGFQFLASCITGDSKLSKQAADSFRQLLLLEQPYTLWLLPVFSFLKYQAVLLQLSCIASTAASTSHAGKVTVGMRQVRAAHKALSPCETALLQLLGVSSEAAVWCAAALLVHSPTYVCADKEPNKALLLTLASTKLLEPGEAPDAEWQQLLLLPPAMLLRWAAKTVSPSGSEAGRQVQASTTPGSDMGPFDWRLDITINACLSIIEHWMNHSAANTSAGASSSSTAGSAAAADSSNVWLQPHPPAEWLQQVLPDIHTMRSACIGEHSAGRAASAEVNLQTQLLRRAVDVSSKRRATTLAGTKTLYQELDILKRGISAHARRRNSEQVGLLLSRVACRRCCLGSRAVGGKASMCCCWC
jgi:hypothetical protein